MNEIYTHLVRLPHFSTKIAQLVLHQDLIPRGRRDAVAAQVSVAHDEDVVLIPCLSHHILFHHFGGCHRFDLLTFYIFSKKATQRMAMAPWLPDLLLVRYDPHCGSIAWVLFGDGVITAAILCYVHIEFGAVEIAVKNYLDLLKMYGETQVCVLYMAMMDLFGAKSKKSLSKSCDFWTTNNQLQAFTVYLQAML